MPSCPGRWGFLHTRPDRRPIRVLPRRRRAAAPDQPEPGRCPPAAADPARKPSASEIVRASRALDALVTGLSGRWKEFQRRYAPEQLDGVEASLQEALARAEVLLAAVTSAAMDDPEGDSTHETARPVAADGELEARRKALDALLWRISSDWQYLRRHPTPDRIGVLRDQIGEALAHAKGLGYTLVAALAAGTARPVEPPSAVDAVRFYPYRDGFTGTYNREGFDAVAGAELKRCRRYGRSFGLVLLEAAPTELEGLRRRVSVISGELRGYDILARYVDRIIVIGLPEAGAGETRRVAARVMRALQANVGFAEADRLALAVMPDDEETLSGLVATARDRLHSAGGE